MKTWGEVQNEVLGLMFSNANGGEKVDLDDASAKEYVINMADSFNYGIRDLCQGKPYIKKYIIRIGEGNEEDYNVKFDFISGKQIRIDFKDISDFSAFGSKGVYFISNDGNIKKISNYFFMGDSEIVLKVSDYGSFLIYYEAYPEKISENTERDFEIKMDDNMLDAVVYYMASRLYAEDDIQLATQYLNIYSDKKNEIFSKSYNAPSSNGESFISERGWI